MERRMINKIHAHKMLQFAEELQIFLRKMPKSKVGVTVAMCGYETFDVGRTVFNIEEETNKLFLALSGAAQVIVWSRLTWIPYKNSAIAPSAHVVSQKMLSERTVALQRSLECSCSGHEGLCDNFQAPGRGLL